MMSLSIRWSFIRAAISTLIGILIAAPAIGQREFQPYFSLASDKTFGPADTPSVYLTGSRIAAVQIRVYRVRDPVAFYSRIESPHMFSLQEQQRLNKRSFLGAIRTWKHSLRRRIRLFIRGQFTESVSAHFRSPKTQPLPKSAASPESYFAAAPVLNQDQLVLSFIQPLGKQNWSSEKVPIRVPDNGIYLVEAVSGSLRAYTIVIKSNLVLVTKTGRQRIVGVVADRTTGEPVRDAQVMVMRRNETPTVFTTNADGLAEIKTSSGAGAASDELRVVVRKGGDVTLSSLSLWNFGDSARNWKGYFYTDRPVYRPGDTIHFRGILRISQSPSGYQIPSGESVAVQIQDPAGKTVYSKHLTVNANGVIHDEFTSERSAALGGYFLQAGTNESLMTGNFEIQEYKKPEYEVRVTSARPRVLQGEKLDLTVNARYYFGEPVRNARVQYSVYRTRYFYPLWRDPDSDDSNIEPFDESYIDSGEEVLKAEGRLDSDGNLKLSYATTVSKAHRDYQYRIEARVTDESRREIAGTGWAVATYGTFLVNVEPQKYFYNPSERADFSLKATDYDGKPVHTSVLISLLRTPQKRDEAPVLVKSIPAVVDASGNGTASLPLPAEGGSYQIKISAQSGNGRTVEGLAYIWIAGAGGGMFSEGGRHTIEIVPDKKKYAPGETANLLIVTGKPNVPVWVAVEGRDVRAVKLLRSATSTVSFPYSVTADDEPGLFVTAQFLNDGEMYQGQKRLVVPPEDHKLEIQISTDKPQYLPGQTATYRLRVTTPQGRAARNADLSLGVVDEAIYAIRPDTTPDILKFFYGNEGSGVYTMDSLTYYFSGEAGNRRMLLAMSTASRSPLAQIKPEALVQPKIRKAFPDTAYWAADVTTDAAGIAETKVSFPDSLTTWRATAKGVTDTNRFGSATEKTIVRKNVVMRLAIPRFFVTGDEVIISGIVHNYLPAAKQARVSVSLVGLDLIGGGASQDVSVPSRSDVRVDWRVKAKEATAATITGEALTNEESDALELTVPIRPQGISIRQPKGGSVSVGGTVMQQITFPSDAEPDSRSISIRLSSSVAGPIFSALDFLTSFPYGCVEQTMSSFLPNLMVARATTSLSGVPRIDEARLKDQVNTGLERLYGMQHDDGGWGWWSSDASHPFMTAYVVAGLAEAGKEGISIRPNVIQKGIGWLHSAMIKDTGIEPDLRAYIAYALAYAGAPDSSLTANLYSQRSQLSPYGVALLGLAFEAVNDARASSVAGELERSVNQNGDEAWWNAERDEMLDFAADVSPEATAYAVKLLTHQRKDSALLPKAVLWLVNHRNQGFWWSSSKQTAMVIYGVLDYLKASNELNGDFTATVKLDGTPAGEQKFAPSLPFSAPEILIDQSKLGSAAHQVTITTSGKGRLYYSITGVHYSNAARLEKQGAVSLNVLRDYFRLVPVQEGDHFVYDLEPLRTPPASGDIVAVRLTVTGSNWRYLLAEDPIPAGTEFIEADNQYQLRSRPPWWRYLFSRRELHDDHMAIFQTYFPQGQQQYFYLLKVVNPGTFHVSPARVEPMYQPGIEATTESRMLEVKP